MAYKPAKPHYVCDRCGVEEEACGTTAAPFRPEGWQYVNLFVCEEGFPEEKGFDVCPVCAALYLDLSAEMGFRFFHSVAGTGATLGSVDLSAYHYDDDDMSIGLTD